MSEKTNRKAVGTPYDDVYRTLQNDCRKWLIPLMNEVFGEHYTGDEQIVPAPAEHFLNRQDGAEAERVTDSSFTILGEVPKKYHVECQSTPDGSMLVRMYEYDSQIALDDARLDGYHMTVPFPRSAVIFLRHNRRTPDRMIVTLQAGGGELSYEVSVIKLQRYSLEEIFEKKLLFFLPFYVFSYEKQFGRMEADQEEMERLREDCRRIREYLEGMCAGGQLTEYEKRIIMDMAKRVLDGIAARHPKVREGVRDVMGGKVLDCEAKQILRQGIEQGIEQGIQQGIEALVAALKELGHPYEETMRKVAEKFHLSEDEARVYMEKLW